jgi:hypothetical protein
MRMIFFWMKGISFEFDGISSKDKDSNGICAVPFFSCMPYNEESFFFYSKLCELKLGLGLHVANHTCMEIQNVQVWLLSSVKDMVHKRLSLSGWVSCAKALFVCASTF